MTDNEIIKELTDIIRSIDSTLKELWEDLGNIEKDCPVCDFIYDCLEQWIEGLEDLRESIIKASVSTDKESKIVTVAVSRVAVASINDKVDFAMKMGAITHDFLHFIARDKIEIMAGTPLKKEDIIALIKEKGIPIPPPSHFDPKKAN